MSTERCDLYEIAAAVAPHLPSWTVTSREAQRTWPALQGPEGREIWFSRHCTERGRFRVYGSYPKHPGGDLVRSVLSYGQEAPGIGLSCGKPPQQIARDIRRRFLPAYEDLFRRCVIRAQEWTEQASRREELARSIQAILGGERRFDGSTERLWLPSAATCNGEVEVSSGDGVFMTLRSVPPDLARDICRLLLRPSEH